MEPKPRLNLQPDAKRRRPLDSVEDAVEPGDVDEEEDWQDWIDDESGTKRAPLPPLPTAERPGLHIPPPEEDFDPERDQEWREWRKNPDDPDLVPRGVWEMKK